MLYIEKSDTDSKPVDRSVDPGKVSPLNRVAFATDLAQSVFRGTYVPPSHTDFTDRSPVEIAIIRAAMWGGAK